MTRPHVAAFAYHDVTDTLGDSGFQRPAAWGFKLSRAAFDDHLTRLAAGPVVPGLVTRIPWERPGRHILLTFDDGGKSALDVAAALERRGWRGHFFITTGRIGAPTFLDAAGIRALHAAGHLVGSHSHSHPDIFRELTAARMAAEWRDSCARLADLLGAPCQVASVPGGDVAPPVYGAAAAAGVRVLFTSEPVLEPRLEAGCRVLGRFVPKSHTSAARIAALARFHGWDRARLVFRLKDALHRAWPALYRMYVGRRTRETLPIGERAP